MSSPEDIYSSSPEEGEDSDKVDIPVVMWSLTSGSILTSAGEEDGEMPDRVRLYAAVDWTFFEDVSGDSPVLNFVHNNMMTEEECKYFLASAEGKTMS